MTAKSKIDRTALRAALAALLPTIDAVARTAGSGGVRVTADTGPDVSPSVRVEIPMPGTNSMTITAEVRFGGEEWDVEAGGWSWKSRDPEQLVIHSRNLATAASLVAILRGLVPAEHVR